MLPSLIRRRAVRAARVLLGPAPSPPARAFPVASPSPSSSSPVASPSSSSSPSPSSSSSVPSPSPSPSSSSSVHGRTVALPSLAFPCLGSACSSGAGPRVWAYSTAASSALEKLSVRELQSFMDKAGIDYRDCIEKRELVKRLQDHSDYLPMHLKSHLAAVIQEPGPGGATPPPPPPLESTSRNGISPAEERTVGLFKRCAPSVVNITSIQTARTNPFSMDVTEVPAGTGSGFVWDTDGHVVTNFHVVQKANKCMITFSNNITCEPDKDLAVLKLARGKCSESQLHPIVVGSSQMLQVGQSVYAIGNPFGLDQTLTSGLVSGLGREVKGITGRPIRDVVQTDAAINPGNSGGPLLDSQGRLIGVNTMIFSPSGASAGIGFAVPSDTVRRVVNQILRHGRVIRPGLGVTVFEDHVAKQLGLEGVLVHSVFPGSGAADAGLKGTNKNPVTGELILGDEIVAVGGVKLKTREDLIASIEIFSVGDMVTLGVRRSGKVSDVYVRLKQPIAE